MGPPMELFPPRPRLKLTRRQAIVGLLALVAANLAAAAIAAYDAEQRRRAEFVPAPPPPPALASGPSLVAGRPLRPNEAGRAVVIFTVCNTIVLGALGFAVLARYLEALRRYNLGLPAGFDESRLKRRHRRAPGLEGARFRDDPGASPHRRFDWPG
jgi:hypothetical protein